MFSSVKGRIILGFGIIMMMLIAATVVNVTLVSGISTDFDQFQAALNRKSQAADIDLTMQKVRVRVNQWLRSMNPDFVKQADQHLAKDVALMAQAMKNAKTDKEKQTLDEMNLALRAYIESWGVIQGLYADEAKIYKDRLIAPAAGIRSDLAELRDDESLEPSLSRILGKARDNFMASETLASQYRTSGKKEDADQLKSAIAGTLVALAEAGPRLKSEANSALLKHIATAVGAWRDSFNDVIKVAEARDARLVTWTNKEGEVMAVGADVLRTEGSTATDQAQAFVVATIARVGIMLLVLSGVIVAIGVGLSWFLAGSITRPLVRMVAVLKQLATNDHSATIPDTDRRDEIGQMAQAAQVFKDNMVETDRLRAERAMTDQKAAAQRKADMAQMADGFESAVGEIIDTVSSAATELEASAGTLTMSAVRSEGLAGTVARASEEASTNVQSVASATEEMSSSINEISRQVAKSANIANEAVDQARKTNDRVAELARAAARIGDVVELINTIAGQTNLLALNATIEAARAGEAGRGFAVVASEVKALAEQTAKATGEISQQIDGIQSATQESVGAIKEIGDIIGRMSEISSTIAAAVEEQGAATREISRNVQQAAQGTTQVSTNIGDVQRGAAETGSASSQVLSAAQSLSSESNRLKMEVGKFMNTVRAA
jgi:methyl-accepting chemotaxis protein